MYQFPLVSSIACTIYKIQGETVQSLMVADWEGYRFKPQQAYICVSRVTNGDNFASMQEFTDHHSSIFRPEMHCHIEDKRIKKLSYDFFQSPSIKELFTDNYDLKHMHQDWDEEIEKEINANPPCKNKSSSQKFNRINNKDFNTRFKNKDSQTKVSNTNSITDNNNNTKSIITFNVEDIDQSPDTSQFNIRFKKDSIHSNSNMISHKTITSPIKSIIKFNVEDIDQSLDTAEFNNRFKKDSHHSSSILQKNITSNITNSPSSTILFQYTFPTIFRPDRYPQFSISDFNNGFNHGMMWIFQTCCFDSIFTNLYYSFLALNDNQKIIFNKHYSTIAPVFHELYLHNKWGEAKLQLINLIYCQSNNARLNIREQLSTETIMNRLLQCATDNIDDINYELNMISYHQLNAITLEPSSSQYNDIFYNIDIKPGNNSNSLQHTINNQIPVGSTRLKITIFDNLPTVMLNLRLTISKEEIYHIQNKIRIMCKDQLYTYELRSIVYHSSSSSHFVSVVKINNEWYYYDGMKQNNDVNLSANLQLILTDSEDISFDQYFKYFNSTDDWKINLVTYLYIDNLTTDVY
jgi:hypothetical protein